MNVTISGRTHALEHGYPTCGASDSIHDEQLLQRAVEAYRFFYPTVSTEAIFEGIRRAGIADGKGLMVLSAGPRHVAFTANSDTPYASGVLDLTAGPVVVEMPAGPFIGLVDDHHQRWIVDMGIPGPDGGRGGRYLIVPPDYAGTAPDGYHIARSPTYKAQIALRAMPRDGDAVRAIAALHEIKLYPLAAPEAALAYVDATARPIDCSPLRWENNIEYWRRLHAIIDEEPAVDEFRPLYGALATLGIAKGRPFPTDARMQGILEAAAALALDEMRVEAFASNRSDRIAWSDRRWEWVSLISDDANFETEHFLDLQARDRWFFQAIVASPAMFRRQVGAGSVYWLAARDEAGAYLDGSRTYKLTIPQPVPASLFWSVTAYDASTRSQVVTPQDKAALGSLHDKFETNANGEVEIYFGPTAPPGNEHQWIQTSPDRGFFLYFRIYGPQAGALDGSWRPSDLTSAAEAREQPAMTEVPASITTPAAVETRFGTLAFPLGIPAEDTVTCVYEHFDYLHAIESFTNSLQAVSLYAMREGFRRGGVEDNQVLLFSRLMDSRSLFLTGNCDTVYFWAFLALDEGPMVLEVPPGVLGTIDDMWFRYITDVGGPGPDRGEGGRYLLVPPGYAGPLPEGGYFVNRVATNHVFLLGRAFLVNNDPAPAVAAIKEGVKIYAYVPGGVGSSIASFLRGKATLTQPIAPPPQTLFVEGTGLAINTVPPNDLSYFDMLDAVVQLEPASALDTELAGQLRAVGIVKDKPFRPDGRMKRILSEAIQVANAAARAIAMRGRPEEGFSYYGPKSNWMNNMFPGGFEFTEPPPFVGSDGVHSFPATHARLLGARTSFFYLATGITPAMCMRMTNLGSQYVGAFLDAEGQPCDGANTYRVSLPPDIPAALFWSLTLYDNQTRSMLQTPQLYPRVGSQSFPSPSAIASEDGSTTVYFGPECPQGVARANWIQTMPSVGYFVILRLYSPLQGFFDKTWRPSEVEPVAAGGPSRGRRK